MDGKDRMFVPRGVCTWLQLRRLEVDTVTACMFASRKLLHFPSSMLAVALKFEPNAPSLSLSLK